jgi:hypothetical protein
VPVSVGIDGASEEPNWQPTKTEIGAHPEGETSSGTGAEGSFGTN